MKTPKLFLCILSMFIFLISKSQDYKYVYYLDGDLNSTTKKKAIILGRGLKEDKLFKLDCYSMDGSVLLISLHFIDSSLAILEGPYSSYHINGKLERQGNCSNNWEEGVWYKWDSLGRKVDSTFFKQGKVFITATFRYHDNGNLSYYTYKDSLQDIYNTASYDEHSVMTEQVFFMGQKGILKSYSDTGIKSDSLFTREEIEATFPDGDRGWTNYLKRTLDANVPVDNRAPAGVYQVIVRFIVKKDGSIENVAAETKHGYGMEKEVIKIVQRGPKWIPARQYGRNVNAYRRQPVTFVVSDR